MKSMWTLFCFVFILNLISAQISFPTENPADVGAQTPCVTPDQERGQCIYLQNCKVLYDLLTKVPRSNDETTYLRRSQCGNPGGDVMVCCAVQQPEPDDPYSSGGPETTESRGDFIPQPGVCGSGSTDRIYGGNKTRIDEFPWMALLQYSKPGNRKGFHCGGVLINNRYVLTASHCVNGRAIPSDWRLTSVRLGEWDTSTDNDCDQDDCSDPHKDITIEKFVPHENYNPRSKNQLNDLALLRLSRKVPYTDWIKAICLPSESHLRDSNYEGVSLDVSGWGKTENASRSNIKLKARVDGVNLDNCNKIYIPNGVTLQDTQLCAGGEKGIDSCQGDSGGPLIGLENPGRGRRPYYYLAGIVSFGPTPCGHEGWPGVYTKIASYDDWIRRNVEP